MPSPILQSKHGTVGSSVLSQRRNWTPLFTGCCCVDGGVKALPGAVVVREGARCQDDLAVPRKPGTGRRHRQTVFPFRQTSLAIRYLAKGEQIVDATIIQASKQHNSQNEKAAIKAGETPEAWKDTICCAMSG